jgi:ferredoxin
MKRLLKKVNIGRLIEGVKRGGGVFVAPKTAGCEVVYAPIGSAGEMVFDYILPRNSFKEFFFPQTEVIANYRTAGKGVELNGVEPSSPPIVVFGARPCDGASLSALRSVFTWDFIDEFYTKRENGSVIVTIACTKGDSQCFCSCVGLSPDGKDGSDILLRETVEGDFTAEATSEKGEKFMEDHKDAFDAITDSREKDIFNPTPLKADLEKISGYLKKREHYGDPRWLVLAGKCIGCGACTYSCPTCHCFDIADEGAYNAAERRKNWDSCQFDFFTLHASGHNPRDAQHKRWRNRFMCKFNFYPEKFSSRGCVGCARCVRVCPVRLDIREVMEEVSKF